MMRSYVTQEELKSEINKSFDQYISDFADITESLEDGASAVMLLFDTFQKISG